MGPAAVARWRCILLMTQVVVSAVYARCKLERSETDVNYTCRGESHFPRGIPFDVTSLDLKDCRIKSLHREDVSRFSRLKVFRIDGNKLRTVEPDALSDNRQLQKLDISRNRWIKPAVVSRLICNVSEANSHLTELYLSVMSIKRPDLGVIVRCLEKASLSVLDLSANDLAPLPDYAFSGMRSLRVLKLGSIFPVNLRALVNLTLLNTLRLSDTKVTEIPSFYDTDNRTVILPNLTALYLDYNEIHSLPERSVGLEGLQFLSLRGNQMTILTAEGITRLSKKLDTLFLNSNKGIHMDRSSFATNMVRLELRDCRIKFTKSICHIFDNMTNMIGLSLTKNYFEQSDDALGVLFHGMPNLAHLTMEQSSIRHIPDDTFKGLYKLKMLTLTGNKLGTLNPNMFRDLLSLQSLHLAQNRLMTIQKEIIDSLPRSLEKVDFAGNPFVCNCDLLWFMKLFRSHKVKFLEISTNHAYICHNPPNMQGKNLTAFLITDADCRHLSFSMKLTIGLSCMVGFIATLIFAVYKFRWYIGYGYFILRAKRREANEREDGTLYAFDAFVVYNRSDLSWVRDMLLPVLEEEDQLHLCIHDRDWLCGRDVIDNIVQSIESSRKTLLVVSNAFASSQWCQLEMTLAQHRLLAEDRNALILVLLEPIERQNLTPRLLLQMKRQTYLEWTEDPVGQRLFWKKLRRSVRKSSRSSANSSSVQHNRSSTADEGRDALLLPEGYISNTLDE